MTTTSLSRGTLLFASLFGSLFALGCTPPERKELSQTPDTYEVSLQVATPASLPKCNAATAGTTAFVASPSGLWSCPGGDTWVAIPCTKILAGAVAYSSASNQLWACVQGQWSSVALPAGPMGATGATGPMGAMGLQGATGAQGATGTEGDKGDPGQMGAPGSNGTAVRVRPEAAGAHCAAGGQAIDLGKDTNGNGALDDDEVMTTAYVCNGMSASAADPPPPPPVPPGPTPVPAAICPGLTAGVLSDVVTLTGTVLAYTPSTGNSEAISEAAVVVLRANGTTLNSALTDTDGHFKFELPTGGAPLNITVRVTKHGFVTATWAPPEPLRTSWQVGILMASSQLSSGSGASLDQGQILVTFADCQANPIQNLRVTAPQSVVYLEGGPSTGVSGTAFLLNVAPGAVHISFSVGDASFIGPTIQAIAGQIVETEVFFDPSIVPDPAQVRANAEAACRDNATIWCYHGFGCYPPEFRDANFVKLFGASLDECMANNETSCANFAASCTGFSIPHAVSCNEQFNSMTCDDFFSGVQISDCQRICTP